MLNASDVVTAEGRVSLDSCAGDRPALWVPTDPCNPASFPFRSLAPAGIHSWSQCRWTYRSAPSVSPGPGGPFLTQTPWFGPCPLFGSCPRCNTPLSLVWDHTVLSTDARSSSLSFFPDAPGDPVQATLELRKHYYRNTVSTSAAPDEHLARLRDHWGCPIAHREAISLRSP